tara:strand:- start:7009 stop:7995 length:987 start_codon:yes stop_codon:yes gene_type:complete
MIDILFNLLGRMFGFGKKETPLGEPEVEGDIDPLDELDSDGTRKMPLWMVIIMFPFLLIGLVLKPFEWVLQILFAPLEMLLPKSWRGDDGLLGTIKTVAYAILIAMVIRTVAYEPFNIPSGSMKPTLLVGDYLFVSKFAYGYSNYALGFGTDLDLFEGRLFSAEPERGDVVVFRKPTDTSIDFIKRVVGLPGDTVQMLDGVLHINGTSVKLEEALPFLDQSCTDARPTDQYIETLPNGVSHEVLDHSDSNRYDNTEPETVPPGHYFMMGDNRDSSNDSRTPGVSFVPLENLIGRADILFFSTNGCGGLFYPWTWPSSIRWDRLFQPVE